MQYLKIGPYEYEIHMEQHTGTNSGFDTDKWGDIRHDLLRIRLQGDAHSQVQLTSLVHEALHGIGFMLGRNYPEDLVVELAPAFVAFLEDNGVDLGPLKKKLS